MRGVAQAHQGDYPAARESFLEAYKLFAHPSILLNLGIAHWHTSEYVAAELDFVRFLSDDGGASVDEIASARAALGAVRAHLGTVRIKVSPEGARAELDAQPVALAPGAFVEVRTLLGTHRVHAEAAGHESADAGVNVDRSGPSVVELSLKAAVEAGDASQRSSRVEEPEKPVRTSRRVVVGWSFVGASVFLAGVGTIAGLQAVSYANDYNTRDSANYQSPDARSTGILFRTTADVSFAAAILCGAAGAYLLLGPPDSWPSKLGARVVVGPRFAGLAGSF